MDAQVLPPSRGFDFPLELLVPWLQLRWVPHHQRRDARRRQCPARFLRVHRPSSARLVECPAGCAVRGAPSALREHLLRRGSRRHHLHPGADAGYTGLRALRVSGGLRGAAGLVEIDPDGDLNPRCRLMQGDGLYLFRLARRLGGLVLDPGAVQRPGGHHLAMFTHGGGPRGRRRSLRGSTVVHPGDADCSHGSLQQPHRGLG
mmetsp:Transcript_27922/g.89929  ORF Transcript_27922/g.89929 Transcript_27922/m.89929 type:complete len:203 (-) Transcript_27922:1152-1760(-)